MVRILQASIYLPSPLFPTPSYTTSRCRGKGTALGLGPSGDEAEPKQILMEEIFVDVSCGATHAAAIAEGGKLYTWGSGTARPLNIDISCD